ncbi:hypothetical protein E2P47_04775 [Candidatus Bathyarchaeota archaeon]|nr:hypothetical protein E2P47_04775 [Candidatus Bathyarchaeota archaeon]
MRNGKLDERNEDPFILSMEFELDRIIRENVCKEIFLDDDPNQVSQKEAELECQRRRSTIMEVLKKSVRMQRLYFVIRSILMGLVSALVTFSVIFYVGSINVIDAIILGIFVFVFSLLFSRLFDNQILSLCLKIIRFLDSHEGIRDTLLRYI